MDKSEYGDNFRRFGIVRSLYEGCRCRACPRFHAGAGGEGKMRKIVQCTNCSGRGSWNRLPFLGFLGEIYTIRCESCGGSGKVEREVSQISPEKARRNLVTTFVAVVLLVLVAFFVLAGCATMPPQRRQVGLIEGVVRFPFAIVGGVAEIVTGYDLDISMDQTSVRIREYCREKYGGDRSDYSACVDGAFGGYGDQNRGSNKKYRRSLCDRFSGVARGKCQRAEMIEADGEQFGASVGAGGSIPLLPHP